MQTLHHLRWVLGFEQVDGEEAIVCGQLQRMGFTSSEEVGYVLHLHKRHTGLFESDLGARKGEVGKSALNVSHDDISKPHSFPVQRTDTEWFHLSMSRANLPAAIARPMSPRSSLESRLRLWGYIGQRGACACPDRGTKPKP